MKTCIALLVVLIATASAATTILPDPALSYWLHDLDQPAGVCVCPEGDGDRLDEARRDGGTVDATITLYLRDPANMPIYLFPPEDLWLEVPGMVLCSGGTLADGPTDIDGVTTFSGELRMGGIQTGDVEVIVIGATVLNGSSTHHRFTSPDLSEDLQVNLTDVVMFAQYWITGVYAAAIDYYYDGVVNLSDLAIFAGHVAHSCP
jgi:hypothetical protein